MLSTDFDFLIVKSKVIEVFFSKGYSLEKLYSPKFGEFINT